MSRPLEPTFQEASVVGPHAPPYKTATADATVVHIDLADPFGDGAENWTGGWIQMEAYVFSVGYFFQPADPGTDEPDLAAENLDGTGLACAKLTGDSGIPRWVDPAYPILSVVGTGVGSFAVWKCQL